MVKKAAKKSPVESTSPYPVGEDARARFKHQSLMQDYEELLKETEAKKKKLQKTILEKRQLLAEVKFLREKYKSFSKNPTQETQYRLKKQSHRIPPPAVRVPRPQNPVTQSEFPSKDKTHKAKEAVRVPRPQNPVTQSEFPSKDKNHKAKEVAAPRKSALLDLNQVSVPSLEEMQEFQVEWEPLAAERSKMCPVDGEAVANDLKLSICRDVGSNSNRVGKRKISWQDPVTLRV